jgi:hypothetical protein
MINQDVDSGNPNSNPPAFPGMRIMTTAKGQFAGRVQRGTRKGGFRADGDADRNPDQSHLAGRINTPAARELPGRSPSPSQATERRTHRRKRVEPGENPPSAPKVCIPSSADRRRSESGRRPDFPGTSSAVDEWAPFWNFQEGPHLLSLPPRLFPAHTVKVRRAE